MEIATDTALRLSKHQGPHIVKSHLITTTKFLMIPPDLSLHDGSLDEWVVEEILKVIQSIHLKDD